MRFYRFVTLVLALWFALVVAPRFVPRAEANPFDFTTPPNPNAGGLAPNSVIGLPVYMGDPFTDGGGYPVAIDYTGDITSSGAIGSTLGMTSPLLIVGDSTYPGYDQFGVSADSDFAGMIHINKQNDSNVAASLYVDANSNLSVEDSNEVHITPGGVGNPSFGVGGVFINDLTTATRALVVMKNGVLGPVQAGDGLLPTDLATVAQVRGAEQTLTSLAPNGVLVASTLYGAHAVGMAFTVTRVTGAVKVAGSGSGSTAVRISDGTHNCDAALTCSTAAGGFSITPTGTCTMNAATLTVTNTTTTGTCTLEPNVLNLDVVGHPT